MAKKKATTSASLPTQHFESKHKWAKWLEDNHDKSPGLWLQLAKKGAGVPSVSYDEALQLALCFGWIDGQKKTHSGQYWLQKFTPRSAKSVWSKNNKEKALALIKAGKMKASGLKEVERAKADGRWDAAYDSASKSTVPSDLQAALDANPKASNFFNTLKSRNRYAILYRVQTAKSAEARANKIEQFVRMLERLETIHPE